MGSIIEHFLVNEGLITSISSRKNKTELLNTEIDEQHKSVIQWVFTCDASWDTSLPKCDDKII
jgi:hypothetical protein